MAWRDSSSYSQGDTERVPHAFTLKSGELAVVVHRYHGCPGEWFYSCFELRVSACPLKSKNLGAAQKQAIAQVRHRCLALHSAARGLVAESQREAT